MHGRRFQTRPKIVSASSKLSAISSSSSSAWATASVPRVKALLSRPGLGQGSPGEVLDDALLIACGEGAVRLLRLQREGRSVQNTDDFVRGLTNGRDLRLA